MDRRARGTTLRLRFVSSYLFIPINETHTHTHTPTRRLTSLPLTRTTTNMSILVVSPSFVAASTSTNASREKRVFPFLDEATPVCRKRRRSVESERSDREKDVGEVEEGENEGNEPETNGTATKRAKVFAIDIPSSDESSPLNCWFLSNGPPNFAKNQEQTPGPPLESRDDASSETDNLASLLQKLRDERDVTMAFSKDLLNKIGSGF